MRKSDSGSAGTGARGAGGIKSNRREGEGQREVVVMMRG